MIGHHFRQGFRTQEPGTVHLSVSEEDAGELQVVVERRPEAAASRFECHLRGTFGDESPRPRQQPDQLTVLIKTVGKRAAMVLFAGDKESGVLHSERREDAPVEQIAERDAFDARKEQAEQISRTSVVHRASGLADQGEIREIGDPFVRRSIAVDLVAQRLSRFAEVRSAYLMSGSYDLLLFVEGRTLREVAGFVSERLAPLEGVLSTSTHFMLKTYKRFGVLMHQENRDERLSVSP